MMGDVYAYVSVMVAVSGCVGVYVSVNMTLSLGECKRCFIHEEDREARRVCLPVEGRVH
jgi:hypothetical protein